MSRQGIGGDAPGRRWLGLGAASRYSGVSVTSLRRWVRSGRLTAFRVTRRPLVDRFELDKLIESCAVRT
jgi:excisionase family DNA binding protein